MPLTMLLYFTGTLPIKRLPDCTEGTLAWVTAGELPRLVVIGSTRPVLPLLIADLERDPNGLEDVRLGVANFQPDGEVEKIAWV